MLNKDLIDLTQLMGEGEAEIIPLLTEENTKDLTVTDMPEEMAILPLRGNVFFPGVVLPITAGRVKSVELIKAAYRNKDIIGVVAQKTANIDDPKEEDLYSVGTMARVLKTLNMPDGTTMVILQGLDRFKLESLTSTEPYWMGKVSAAPDKAKDMPRIHLLYLRL